jgi:hypothetical protein
LVSRKRTVCRTIYLASRLTTVSDWRGRLGQLIRSDHAAGKGSSEVDHLRADPNVRDFRRFSGISLQELRERFLLLSKPNHPNSSPARGEAYTESRATCSSTDLCTVTATKPYEWALFLLCVEFAEAEASLPISSNAGIK